MSNLLLSLFLIPTVFATVGGATHVSLLSYSPQEQTVYYLEEDGGGRGCPPIIQKINVASKQQSAVKTCDELEADPYPSNDYFIAETFRNLVPLSEINLEENKISVAVSFVSEQLDPNGDGINGIQQTFLKATVFQDGIQKGTFDFTGCTRDQQNTFEAYRIPDSTSIALVLSGKKDCFEGGYLTERVFLVDGIIHDNNTKQSYTTWIHLAIIILLGFGVGYALGKKTRGPK